MSQLAMEALKPLKNRGSKSPRSKLQSYAFVVLVGNFVGHAAWTEYKNSLEIWVKPLKIVVR